MSIYTAFARHYDALTGNVNYRERASYFDALIRLHGGPQGGLLLDLACGTGSLSVELAALGYEVIGVDGSPDMLSVAQQKAAGCGVLFLCQSMDGLDLYGTVRHTVCALDSLNHLPDETALAQTIERVSLFTEAGGLFVFDVNTAFKHREILADNVYVYEPDNLFCCWRNTYRPGDGSVEIALDFFERLPDGRYLRSEERFCERLFSHDVLAAQLERCGMRLLAVYGDDTLGPPGDHTQRAVFVARKEK